MAELQQPNPTQINPVAQENYIVPRAQEYIVI
jgi:hypothetical protein